MADLVIELPDGDITPLLDHLEGVTYVNLSPGVDPDAVPPAPSQSPLGNLFGNRGPVVPLATWTPGEIGLQHMVGQRAVRFLAGKGVTVPEDWYVVADHPRRGLVLRTYHATPEMTLGWLVQAARATCPIEITVPWRAVVHTR